MVYPEPLGVLEAGKPSDFHALGTSVINEIALLRASFHSQREDGPLCGVEVRPSDSRCWPSQSQIRLGSPDIDA